MLGRLRFVAANSLAAASHARAARRFAAALRDPAIAQARLLARLLERNAETAFGRQHRFANLRGPAAYQAAVPISDHGGHLSWIDRALHGESGVLTAEPILMFEKTSGSTRAAKYIPYTASLRHEFQEATGAWLFDLWRHRPGLRRGGAYWSVSPAAREREFTPGGLPVGFADDTEYFDPLTRWVLRQLLVVPGTVAHAGDMAAVRAQTVALLAGAPHLVLISVWNPTFLSLLVDDIPDFAARRLWPDLDLISCWTDAAAARFVPDLAARFPGVTIQGKGLLSTEGVVSIPLCGHAGAALAVTSHFLEFETGGDVRPQLAHEIEPGGRYGVVLTTGGGLYRYRTHDEIEVVGRVAATPLVRFMGKRDQVSDQCGEKLAAMHVEGILADLLPASTRFAMLAPEAGPPTHYVLYAECGPLPDAHALDARLRENPHYAYARDLGQLGSPRVVAIEDGQRRYLAGCEALGQKPGNVKPVALHRALDWGERFGAGQPV